MSSLPPSVLLPTASGAGAELGKPALPLIKQPAVSTWKQCSGEAGSEI